jgi:hypothetical protein
MKRCAKCKKIKPFSDFLRAAKSSDGYYWSCKACNKDIRKLAEQRRSQRGRKYAPNVLRNMHLKKYGLTVDSFNEMLRKQDGKCAICKTDKPGGRYKVFMVDHCHETGKVRGLLCHICNVRLAAAGDNLENVMRLVRYLQRDGV